MATLIDELADELATNEQLAADVRSALFRIGYEV
jgi:hypothetical protein